MSQLPLPPSTYRITGTQPGPRVVVFGGTHGNETTGVTVVHQLLRAFHINPDAVTADITSPYVQGELILGIGNPEAVACNQRSVSGVRDLNRCFHESFFASDEAMQLPDQQRAAELKDLLAQANYFFDLHSVSATKTVPFVGITTMSEGHQEICKEIPVPFVVDVNAVLGQDVGLPSQQVTQTPTTCSWVNRHGGVGLCFEMGSQLDESSVSNALKVVLHLLEYVGVVIPSLRHECFSDVGPLESSIVPIAYRLAHCERNKFTGFQYADERFQESFVSVKKGEVVGFYADGEQVVVPEDGVIVFPAGAHTLDHNSSLFYLGIPLEKE